MSIVKIVLTLFVIDAKEETIAATKAANVNPKIPFGSMTSSLDMLDLIFLVLGK